jgi:CheY-like chemotaxis protein
MEVLKGFEYTIIKMPENISVDSIDVLLEEFNRNYLVARDNDEFLLDMQKIVQLHRGALLFITKLNEILQNAGCRLYIAGLNDPVENALIFNHINDKTPLFKALIDFEKQKELVFNIEDTVLPETGIESDPVDLWIKKSNVLLIEPNLALRQNQKTILNKLSINNLVEVKDMSEALKKMRDIPFKIDLILLDLEQIKLNVSQFIISLLSLQSCRNAKIICTIIKTTTQISIDEAMKAGSIAVIIKNFNEEKLSEIFSNPAIK